MADTVSKERRSEIMSNVKSSNTKPEVLVRKFLFSQGIRFRLHDKALPGKPDLKIPKYKTVVLSLKSTPLIFGAFFPSCNISL